MLSRFQHLLTKHKFHSIEGKQYTQKRLQRQEYADTKGSEKIFFMPRKKKLGVWPGNLNTWRTRVQHFLFFIFGTLRSLQFTAHAFGHRFNCLLYPRIMTYHSSDLVNLNSVQPLNQWWANPLMAICVFPMHPKEFCNTPILLHRIMCTSSTLVILSGS